MKGRLWMALHAYFCKMNILLVMLEYVPCQTSIPYSKNELMREKYNVFIISSDRYSDNLNNMPTDFDIFRAMYRVQTDVGQRFAGNGPNGLSYYYYYVNMMFECEMFIKNYS